MFVGATLAASLIGIAWLRHFGPLAFLPLVVLMGISALTLHYLLRRLVPQAQIRAAALLIGLALLSAVIWWFVGFLDGLGLISAFAFALGLGLWLGQSRTLRAQHPYRGSWLFAVAGILLVTGMIPMVAQKVPILSAGFLLIGLVLSASRLALLAQDISVSPGSTLGSSFRRRGWIWLAVGMGALVIALLLLMAVQAFYAPHILFFVFVSVGLVIWDGDEALVVLALVLLFLFVLHPRTEDEPSFNRAGDWTLVAFGDSYMSGEGAKKFYEGTNEADNGCRRSPKAYPVSIAELGLTDPGLPDSVIFLSCSGALAKHIYAVPKSAGEPVGGPVRVDGDGFGPLPDTKEKGSRGMTQLGNYNWRPASEKEDVRLVLISVGGNDSGFAKLVGTCLAPGDCSDSGRVWLGVLESYVADEVGLAYVEIEKHPAFDDVPIAVVPYPIPLNREGCGWSLLSPAEHDFLSDFTEQLNEILRREANSQGFFFINGFQKALDDEGELALCDNKPGLVGVNMFSLHPQGGSLEDAFNLSAWFHNSMHPNDRGHEVLTGKLRQWIEQEQDRPSRSTKAIDGLANVESLGEAISDYPICLRPGTNEACQLNKDGTLNNSSWILDQVLRGSRRAFFPLTLAATASAVFWILLICQTGSFFKERRDRYLRRQRSLSQGLMEKYRNKGRPRSPGVS
jgi:hypothetical protein